MKIEAWIKIWHVLNIRTLRSSHIEYMFYEQTVILLIYLLDMREPQILYQSCSFGDIVRFRLGLY
jgi:hypothetical protein